LDRHLARFEKFNQGFISILQLGLLLFTDAVYDRKMQFDFGYYYAGGLFWFNSICLFICVLYAFEPIRTWIRYRHLRLEQIRLAIELRARLIIEAKERKEARK
jgi:hypothetical protein